jgi:hypothetical protein
MKCKVITTQIPVIEEAINFWLKSGKYEISHILQSQSDVYITITIFYLEQKEVRAMKLNKLNNHDSEN